MRIDRYEIEETLGAGGFGTVYRARHAILGHAVALKVLLPEHAARRDVVDRFLREAKAAAAVGSPHIVRVIDVGTTEDGRPFLVMEILEGRVLHDILEERRVLPLGRAVGIALQTLDGLSAAHAIGIVHRDLKPANLFVCTDPDGGGDFVKILDFGISKMRPAVPSASDLPTKTGAVLGTPGYMAPEQLRGAREVDARADLYSVSVVLYRMISGDAPYKGDSYEDLVVRVCTERPKALSNAAPGVPVRLCEVVDRGLARDPDARFQSATQYAQALRAALGEGVSLVGPGPTAPIGRRSPAPPSYVTPPPAVTSRRPASVPAAGSRPRSRAPLALFGMALGGVLLGALAVGISRGVATQPTAVATVFPATTAAPITPFVEPPRPAIAPVATAAPFVPVLPTTMAPQPIAPVAIASTAPAPEAPAATSLLVHEPRIIGQLEPGPVMDVLRRARGAMDECRQQGAAQRVMVHVHVGLGRIQMANPAPDNSGSVEAARCVARCFRQSTPPDWTPGDSGIIEFEVTLPPR